MSSPLRVPVPRLGAGRTTLPADAARYVARVHRAGPGDRLLLFDPERGLEADAAVLSVGAREVDVDVGPPRASSARPTRALTLLQGVSKGDKLDAVVRDATELGATRVVPVVTERSVARLEEVRRADRLRRVAVEASRQCGRGDLVEVDAPVRLGDALARYACAEALSICLDPRSALPLGPVLAQVDPRRPILALVGPEGGLSPAELALLGERGFVGVRLGRFVLRTETVCAALLGAVAAWAEGLGPRGGIE